MRHITDRGLALIRQFEGFQPQPYRCPAGYLTIGYGHVVRHGEEFPDGINVTVAEAMLRIDARFAEQTVLRLITVPLTDGQFDALVSFTFNLGGAALQRSTLRRKINRGDHEAAAEEFGKWVWAGGRKLKGLVRRRQAEAQLYQS